LFPFSSIYSGLDAFPFTFFFFLIMIVRLLCKCVTRFEAKEGVSEIPAIRLALIPFIFRFLIPWPNFSHQMTLMRSVLLIFPDTKKLSEFLAEVEISNAEVNTGEKSLIAQLPDDQIQVACSKFDAFLKTGFKKPLD